VDELTGEVEIVREELNAMQQSRTKLRQRISELEDELKKAKEQVKQQSMFYQKRRMMCRWHSARDSPVLKWPWC